MAVTTDRTETVRLVAYIPAELHRQVKAAASAENRTISNYLETLLRAALKGGATTS
jgi:hypothetical protein